MIQQINLYQLGSRQSITLWRNPYLLTLLGVVLYLVVVGGISSEQLADSQAKLKALQNEQTQLQSRLQTLQSQFPDQQSDALLNQEIQHTQTVQHSLSRILGLLADDQTDQTRGFSGYLTALATQSDSKAWLTGIQIDGTSSSIRLQGSTFKPENIALLLQRLQHTDAFKNRQFAKLSIQQSASVSEQVDFDVSSHFKDDTEVNNAQQR